MQYRLKAAGELLTPKVAGKYVVELGCGSGFLARDLIDAVAMSYAGCDIAETAVARANEIAREAGISEKVRFFCEDLLSVGALDAVLCFR